MSTNTGQNFMTGVIPTLDAFAGGKLGDMSAVSITTIATILTPTTGKKLLILGGEFSMSADASVLFEDNSSTTANFIYRSPLILAKTPWRFTLGNGRYLSAADNVLKATASAAGAITGVIWYAEV